MYICMYAHIYKLKGFELRNPDYIKIKNKRLKKKANFSTL